MAQMASGDLSLTSTSSQEAESSEYVGYERTLRPQAAPGNTLPSNILNNNNDATASKSRGANRNQFEVIKSEYDSALLELSCLRLQHSNTERRCGELATQLNYYQQQYVAAVKQLKSSVQNALPDVSVENERLKRENAILERKLLQLEGQSVGSRPSNADPFYCSLTSNERGNYNFYRKTLEENEKLKLLLDKETKEGALITAELQQLLSEKDSVLLEHQKMSDELAMANKNIEKYKKEEQIYKKEIASLKLANDELSKLDLLTSHDGLWPKGFADNKDDPKEIEKLRKNLEKATSEVERATRETEDAKRVRDWTIQQREKIVLERDSVKSLCDNLRKERDKAISDLLAAIRDNEEIKRLKDEAQKEIDMLRENMETSHVESASRPSVRANNHEAEDLLEIDLSNYTDGDLGIILDDTNNRHLVCGVTSNSPAFGKLKINDVLRKVNGLECQSMTKHMVLNEIRVRSPHCTLLVSRTRHSMRHFYTVHLNMRDHISHGLHLEPGVFISKIEHNSLAANEPELDVGDRVLSINNRSLEDVQSISDIMTLLNDTRNEMLTIFGLKSIRDVGNCETKNRTTTSSVQTESPEMMQHINSSKHGSKLSELFRKLIFTKSGNVDDNFSQEHDAIAALDSVLSENSSEKSKENLFKRTKRSKKEKESAAVGTWPRTNILQATKENPTGTIVQRNEKKRALLSLFTAGPINVDKDDDDLDAGSEPPPLPPLITKPKPHIRSPGGTVKSSPNRNSNPVPTASFFQQPVSISQQSNASPDIVSPNYARHSIYGMTHEPTMQEHAKALQRPAPIMGANARLKLPSSEKYGNGPRMLNTNRYSLNIAPTEYYKTSGQQAQQQVVNPVVDFSGQKHQLYDTGYQKPNALFMSLNASNSSRSTACSQQYSTDIGSLKSQNSIDSILSAKSPHISEYSAMNYPKRGQPIHQGTSVPMAKHSSKFPSDSESISSGILLAQGANASYQLPSSQASSNRHTQLFPSFAQSSTHGMRHIRHSSPLTLPHSQQNSSHSAQCNYLHNDNASTSGTIGIPTSSMDRMDMDCISSSQSSYLQDYQQSMMQQQQQQHQHNQQYQPLGLPITGTSSNAVVQSAVSNLAYENGTFPRKKDHQRLRIPSNPSVASKNSGVKNSSGSIDHYYASIAATHTPSSLITTTSSSLMHHSAIGSGGVNGGSGRGSPMPHVHVEVLSHGGGKRNSNVPADFICPGDLRRVTIDKSDKSLGITIQCNNNGGGIFVSTVADKSIATRAGLQVGDQLLEVCGINMRAATNEIAGNVLRQCGNSIVMLVQYNPEKFHPTEYDCAGIIETDVAVNHSGSPTPRNSPQSAIRNMATVQSPPTERSTNASCAMTTQNSLLLNQKSLKGQGFCDRLDNQSDVNSNPDQTLSTTKLSSARSSTGYHMNAAPRYVTLHMGKSKNLGIKLFGGNNVGIFVHDVAAGSPSDCAGIRKGDQILEYNEVDLRGVTAEYAANEIAKLSETLTMLVQYNLQTLKKIKDESGDSFYIRVGFDRVGDLSENDLRFVKDEVLHVDNTLYNGTYGHWRAWKLDALGHHRECGAIPSQSKVEEELRSTEVIENDTGAARRGSTSARRSFFRRKKHQRSSSRDSTEIASFSNTQLSFFPECGMLNEDGAILSYQRVELLNSPIRRPVLIIGPLSECVTHRLIMDFSNLFKLCDVTAMDCSQEAMEESLQKNIFVDYRRRGNKFECTTVEAVNNASKNDRRHCLLDVSISAIDRLQRLRIYPIVLLLRFKSAKQIREIRDYGTDKISAKAAKEMYERALKLESDYKQYISAVIPGVSIKHMCTQIKDAVDKEQDKLLWVPVSNP